LRVCILTREYRTITSYSGGIGTLYALLAPELARQGLETHVVTVAEQDSRHMEREGVRLHLVPVPWPRFRLPALAAWTLGVDLVGWTIAVDRVVRELGTFDAVLAAEWGGDAQAYARHKRSGPLVTNLHTSLAQILEISPGRYRSPGTKLRESLQQKLERAQTQRSDSIVAPSRAVLGWARELWNIEGIPSTVVPNMVDVERVRRLAEGRPPSAFPEGAPVVAFSGRLETRKGPHVLAEAMRSVWREFPDARLVMLGEDSGWRRGRMSEHLLQLVGNFRDRVHLLGDQPPVTLFPALARADVVALPSLWENFSLASLEAMALGKPLVVTSGSGFAEFIRDGREGCIVPPSDSESLASAIIELLGDGGLRQRLGAAAARAAVMKYSPPFVTKRFVQYFERVAREA
jgi:glycogen(starch) synthase